MSMNELETRVQVLEGLVESLEGTINKLNERLEQVEGRRPVTTRDRGPKSERQMSPEDAYEVMYGSLKDMKVKDVAVHLGVSRGQIYSVRGGYTFTYVTEDWKS